MLQTNETWSLVTRDLDRPKAITFHHGERKLYWAAVKGSDLRLSRARPDGSEREELCRLQGHEAFAILVDGAFIYWSEWSSFSVWRVDVTKGECRPELVKSFSSAKPHGLAVVTDQKLHCDGAETVRAPEPAGDVTTETAVTSQATEGDPRCESLCLEGECLARLGQAPECQCEEGWTGARCQVSLCQNFCLHEGVCLVIEDQPECVCQPGHHGDRCQLIQTKSDEPAQNVHDCDGKNDLLVILLSAGSVVLTLVVVLLSVAVHRLRLRPRVVRKRFISVAGGDVKDGPDRRASCGLPVEDSLQLDIENCCNMTLCETVRNVKLKLIINLIFSAAVL